MSTYTHEPTDRDAFGDPILDQREYVIIGGNPKHPVAMFRTVTGWTNDPERARVWRGLEVRPVTEGIAMPAADFELAHRSVVIYRDDLARVVPAYRCREHGAISRVRVNHTCAICGVLGEQQPYAERQALESMITRGPAAEDGAA